MSAQSTPPAFRISAFDCPNCDAYAEQVWCHVYETMPSGHSLEEWTRNLYLARCTHCKEASVWIRGEMVYPAKLIAPLAHPDMPKHITKDYDEARSVLGTSPRSAAALLRLCVQKLCIELGELGENINADIGSLVAKGLSVKVQQALDLVRVVGNEQVHPGTLDVRDNPEIATKLFVLVNFIVDDQISKPMQIAELYKVIPDAKLKGIEQRDKTKPNA